MLAWSVWPPTWGRGLVRLTGYGYDMTGSYDDAWWLAIVISCIQRNLDGRTPQGARVASRAVYRD